MPANIILQNAKTGLYFVKGKAFIAHNPWNASRLTDTESLLAHEVYDPTYILKIEIDAFDTKDFIENPEKYDRFKTAYCKDLGAYCSIKKVNHKNQQALVNFGHQDVWTPLSDLSRFCL